MCWEESYVVVWWCFKLFYWNVIELEVVMCARNSVCVCVWVGLSFGDDILV